MYVLHFTKNDIESNRISFKFNLGQLLDAPPLFFFVSLFVDADRRSPLNRVS